MDKWFRRVEIFLLVLLGLIYVGAKVHFFSRYSNDTGAYLAEHWPFWAAAAIVGVVGAMLEVIRRIIHSRGKN